MEKCQEELSQSVTPKACDQRLTASQEARKASLNDGPREKLLQRGPRALSDAELLAVLLRTGVVGEPVTALAGRLLAGHDGLAGLLSSDPSTLLAEPGLGPAKLAVLLAALELGRRCAEQPLTRHSVMASPALTQQFLRQHLSLAAREVFCCLYLDAQHRLIHYEDLFVGTLDGAAVYPREVVMGALRQRATAVILAHNHPSGVLTPSEADRRITRRLKDALALIDVRVLDHVIVGRGGSFSFAEEGLM